MLLTDKKNYNIHSKWLFCLLFWDINESCYPSVAFLKSVSTFWTIPVAVRLQTLNENNERMKKNFDRRDSLQTFFQSPTYFTEGCTNLLQEAEVCTSISKKTFSRFLASVLKCSIYHCTSFEKNKFEKFSILNFDASFITDLWIIPAGLNIYIQCKWPWFEELFTVIWNLQAFYSLQIEHYALKITFCVQCSSVLYFPTAYYSFNGVYLQTILSRNDYL